MSKRIYLLECTHCKKPIRMKSGGWIRLKFYCMNCLITKAYKKGLKT